MMELRLSVRHHGDRAMIHISGEIDLATCPQLQSVVVDLVDRGCHQLILDLERVSFMDCAGIRVLVDARRRVQEHGGSVRLVRPRPLVWRVLALTGMTTVFPIETSLGEATTPTAWPPAAASRRPELPASSPAPQPEGLQRPLVEVLAFPGCPNRDAAIALAERVCADLGSNAEIQVLDITDQQAAEQARSLGSPTIRVNGRDVEPGAEECVEYLHTCRLYQGKHSLRGLPEEIWLRQALQAAQA
jgi:anti-sigma B factor antagonist